MAPDQPPYGDLTELNQDGKLLRLVGKGILEKVIEDALELLDTSAAVGIFSSSWCRFLDETSCNLCQTDDNREALKSGRYDLS